MANPSSLILSIAAGMTPVAVGVHVWAVVQPHMTVLSMSADLLDTAALLAWIAYIASWCTARVVRRVDELERAHSVRIYADAVNASAPSGEGGRLRRLT
jgi:ABC-type nickel/cobalt efflux system permease component RcnA